MEVLGPLRLVVDGEAVDVRGPKRRAVLALLAIAGGRTVPVDDLVDALWPSEVPDSARAALQSHVFRLRSHLGPAVARLETHPDGYRLDLEAGELDLAQVRMLLSEARSVADRDPHRAVALLRESDRLWRGPMLPDLTDVLPIAAAVEGWTQLHKDVTDALIGSAVAADRAEDVLGLAASTVAADPLREPAVLLQMRVLAATAQAAEAMRIGRDYRRRLADETGLDPTPALAALERAIAGGMAGPPPAGPKVAQAPPARLIGRDRAVASLHRLLAAERLVTIVGPGGVGKTSVALEVARRSEPATVLLLAPVTDPAGLPHALAETLGLSVAQGDVLSACIAVLGDEPGVLVIDNCEHLLDAARETVGLILAGCPRLSVLTTSREPLGLPTEYSSRLAPLPLPGADGDLREIPSVAVFVDRARRVRRGPPPTDADLRIIADIVRRLDGMPLAIELAAGRLSTLSLTDLRVRLDRSLDLLGGGRTDLDARHRTLRATIAWSYDLLSFEEQELFRRLSIFPDGVDLATAEALAAELTAAGDPTTRLARLVDASMIEADFTGGTTRYRMLETLRAFGVDRLEAAGETDAAAERILRWAVALAAWIEDTSLTAQEPDADAVLRRELPNLRAAFRLARSRGALDEAAAIVTPLIFVVAYRDLTELRGWAKEVAADPTLVGHPREAAVLGTAAEAMYHEGEYPAAERLARKGLERADDASAHFCLFPLSVAELARGAYADVMEHSLLTAELAGRPHESLGIAALAAAYAGDLQQARELNDRGTADAHSPTMLSWANYVAGEIESAAAQHAEAERHYVRAIDLARESGATFLVGVASVGLLAGRARAGRTEEALTGYRDVVDYFARTGNWTHLWVTLRNLTDLLRQIGDDEPAALLETAADQAPDAPAVPGGQREAPTTPPVSRSAVLEIARRAIEENLQR